MWFIFDIRQSRPGSISDVLKHSPKSNRANICWSRWDKVSIRCSRSPKLKCVDGLFLSNNNVFVADNVELDGTGFGSDSGVILMDGEIQYRHWWLLNVHYNSLQIERHLLLMTAELQLVNEHITAFQSYAKLVNVSIHGVWLVRCWAVLPDYFEGNWWRVNHRIYCCIWLIYTIYDS